MSDKLSVVLVDDSRSVLSQLQTWIADIDGVHVVGTAADGAGAVRVVAETRPDLVLMDIVMPGMDGLAALRLIRARHKGLRVMMLSSVGGAGTRAEEAFSLGAVQVIGKPVDRDQFESLLEIEHERKRMEEEG
jgi:YesN/AraC family two-component response regulator